MEMDKYPFEVDDDDHCETPIEAFADIAVLLEKYAMELNKTKESLIIYDPYFCEGSSSLRLKSLGFPQVYNKKEDFYQRMQHGLPSYDVIVTNPPYSGDHIERLINFVFASNKPWFLLIPNFVYMKPYYTSKLGNRSSLASSLVFYVTPLKRYLYSTPKGRRQKKSSKYTSPFPTFWFANLYRYTDNVLEGLNLHESRIHTDLKSLPREVLTELDPRAKRLRDSTKRKKNKERKRIKTE